MEVEVWIQGWIVGTMEVIDRIPHQCTLHAGNGDSSRLGLWAASSDRARESKPAFFCESKYLLDEEMGKKAAKATRKFAQSGELKRKIQERRKHAKVKKEATQRQAIKSAKERERAKSNDGKGGKSGAAGDDSEADDAPGPSSKSK